MPKFINDACSDAAFDYIDQSDHMRVLSAYSAGDSHATVVTNTLADAAMTVDTDYTKAQGDAGAGSRKVTTAAKNGVSVAASGTATHVALTRTADTSVRAVTTCTSQVLTSGNTVNVPAWKIEHGIPS